MSFSPEKRGYESRLVAVDILNPHLAAAPVVVVIPTYNERGNVERLVQAIAKLDAAIDVLVADDGSPDGTAESVLEATRDLPRRVYVMRRKAKYGLGVCYLDAFAWIQEQAPQYQFIVQMDADFSHPPEALPRLIEAARIHGAAIGSRYVSGGSTPDWNWPRVLLSKGGNFYARNVLRLFRGSYAIHDNTAGFIAWRSDVLRQVLERPIPGDGYSFLTALKFVAYRIGYTPCEVPIEFRDRRLGVSKLSRHIIVEAFFMPWRLGIRFRSRSHTATVSTHPESSHDNSAAMWDRYYASEDETGWFAKLVHWAREVYFGGLFARRVQELGGKASSYLEIGVGTAQTLARLQQRTGARCVGIEKTPRAHELGKAYATKCELVLGDGLHAPFADKSFDVIYSLGLLEHFEPVEQAQLLREQARIARQHVLVEVPTHTPHMRAILWFNRRVLGKRGVWADEELFSAEYFRKKYPGLPFDYFFDWASGCMTCWFVMTPEDIERFIPSEPGPLPKPDAYPALWVLGVAALAAIAAVLPYWLINLFGPSALPMSWWRVPVTTPGVFDTYVYLHWMGAAANGLAYGGHLKWLGPLVLTPLWSVMQPWASLPELWIVTRGIVLALTLWIGARCVQRWSGLDAWKARAVILGLWFTLLPLSLRPGVYSWYLPFCILGLTLILPVMESLKTKRLLRAIVWSLGSVLLTSIYPWFLMTAVIWLATIWGAWLIRMRRVIFPSVVAISVVSAWSVAGPLARWFLDPARAGFVGSYERNGIAFAHVPFFSNTVIAIVAWIVFLVVLAYRTRTESIAAARLAPAIWGWLVLFFLWFNTPFTGIHLYSDHFIAPVVVLAWLSLSIVWSVMESGSKEMKTASHSIWTMVITWIPPLIAAGSTAFFFYVLQQPVLRNVWRFDSYVIHLTLWFALAVASLLVVWRSARREASLSAHFMAAFILLPTLTIGIAATLPVILRDLPRVPGVMAEVPVIEWINAHIPPNEMLCADPATASFTAAMTGRRVNPAEATLSYPDSSEQVIRNLETLAGAYDASSSGNLETYHFATDHYRTIPCAEGAYAHNGGLFGLMRRLGIEASIANDLMGCRQQVIDAHWTRVKTAIERHDLDVPAFRALCPAVIVPDAQRKYWQIPSDYMEQRIGDHTSLWKTP